MIKSKSDETSKTIEMILLFEFDIEHSDIEITLRTEFVRLVLETRDTYNKERPEARKLAAALGTFACDLEAVWVDYIYAYNSYDCFALFDALLMAWICYSYFHCRFESLLLVQSKTSQIKIYHS